MRSIRLLLAALVATTTLLPGVAAAELLDEPEPRPSTDPATDAHAHAASRAEIRTDIAAEFARLGRLGPAITAAQTEAWRADRLDDVAPSVAGAIRQLLDERRFIDGRLAELQAELVEANRPDGEPGGWEEFGLDYAVFPVPDVAEFVDSWGASRSGGRRHKGTDLLAPRGTDLLAIEDGVIEIIKSSRLGGKSVYLIGASGSRYYYTHLDGYAEGLLEGQSVSAGDLIGYNGDTGNARGTPHLHFQWAPDGENGWRNPYPLLQAIWTTERGDASHVR